MNFPIDYSNLADFDKVNNSIADGLNPSKTLNFQTCSIAASGNLIIDLYFNAPPTVLLTGQQFQNTSLLRYGFCVYISEAGNNVSFIPKTLYNCCIASTGIFTINTPFLTGNIGVRFTIDTAAKISTLKYGLQGGKYYKISLITVGQNGTMSIVGNKSVLCAYS